MKTRQRFHAFVLVCEARPDEDNGIRGIMKQEQGFSLVEAMIALAICVVLLAGILASLNRSAEMNAKTAEMADLEQNLRAGLNYLVEDFISAGWGIPVGGIPIPSGAGVDLVVRPGPPDSAYTFASETISAVNPGPTLGPAINGRATDIVNILYADSSLPLNAYQLTAVGANGSSATVDARTPINGDNPIRVGDLIYLSNALGATLQYVTGVIGQTISFGTSDPMNLNQPGFPGSVTQIRGDDGNFPPTSATRVYLITYYLDASVDPQIPRLVRRVNANPGRVVALVLEDLQMSYDLVDGAANPTGIKIPVSPNGPAQIRKANLTVSGRTSSLMEESESYLRRSLTTQVSLRSLSYIDRYR